MYQILVGLDTDVDRAMAQAAAIKDLPAVSEEVTAILTHVFQDNPEGASVQHLESVRAVADSFDESDIDYELYEASGEPASELITAAADLEVDMICLSGRQRTPAGKVVFGSVTQAVIIGTDLPVTTVSPEA